jgi:hypothetical protein
MKLCLKAVQLLVCFAALACYGLAQDTAPAKHPVRSVKSAARIGEAELIRVYGKGVLSERPFKVTIDNGVWTVASRRWCQEALPKTGFVCSGGHWVRLSSEDGHILAVGGEDAQQ